MRGRTALLVGALAALLLAAAAVPLPLLRAIERSERELLVQQWRTTLDALLTSGDPETANLQAEAHRIAGLTRAHVVLRSAQGASAMAPAPPSPLQEPGPEVERARRDGFGWAERRWVSNGPPFLHLARFARSGAGIRIALSLEQLAAIDRRRAQVAHALALLIGLILALALLLMEHFQRRAERGLADRLRFAAEAEPLPRSIPRGRWSATLEAISAASFKLGERIEAEKQRLTGELELLKTILDGMAEGVLAVDAAGRILMSNASLCELFGVETARRAAAEHYLELVRHHALGEAIEYCLRTGSVFHQRLSFDALRERSFELEVRPLKVGGERGAVAVLVEVTRLERLQATRQRFLADASHELRTPLTAIRSLAETLSESDLKDRTEVRGSLERLLQHCDRIENLLRDITDLSKIESGSVVLHPERIALRPACEEIVRLFQAPLHRRRIETQIEIDPEAEVFADRQRLEQILINLIDNAIKFNRDGGSIRIAHQALADRDQIEVEDSGIGIPVDQREQIFHRFYRVNRPQEEATRGTGLGLAIVRHLVQLHSGAISVDSELGSGSRFVVSLPRGA
ncbi:MAG TPA: ATP-binding protein [Acidobacteriota bacterium]